MGSKFSEESHDVYKKRPIEESIRTYDTWTDYDKDLESGGYRGPEDGAEALAKFYTLEQRKSVKILDVGAGTGILGDKISKLGFKNFDALDGSIGMLKILKERGLYGKVTVGIVGDGHTVNELRNDSYDCLITIGSMMDGHIPLDAIEEFIRLVKPDGQIFTVIREEFTFNHFDGKFHEYVKSLENKGLWKLVCKEIYPDYIFGKDGAVYIYKVL